DEAADDELGQLALDQPELGDRAAELVPLPGVPDRLIERELRPADVPAPQLEPPEVENVEGDEVPLADLAEHVLDRDAAVFEHERGRRAPVEPELLLLLAADHARPALDDESGEFLAADFGEDDEEVGEAPGGDPPLLAA